MAIDIFGTRAMAAAMRQDKPAGTFLLDTFFTKVETSEAETVDIDIVKGKRRLAPFQTPRIEGKLVEKRGFTTNSYKPAYIKPKKILEASDIVNSRSSGESAYSMQTAEERAQTKLAEELMDLEDMVTRREEWMAAQQLVNGYVDVVGDGVNYRIDLSMDATHKITAGTAWSDVSNATPTVDVGAAVRLISKDSGKSANVMVGNSAAIEEFLNTTEIGKKLDIRRLELGQISPEQFDGATYYGDIFIAGKRIAVWSYDEWYIDDTTGDELPMIPDGKVVVASTGADARRHYGAIRDRKAGFAALPRFPKTWDEEDPAVDYLMVQSAPLPAFHEIDAVCVLTV